MLLQFGVGSRLSRLVLFSLGVAGAACTTAAAAPPPPLIAAGTIVAEGSGYSSSEDPTSAPVFSLNGGNYTAPQTLKLTDCTPGAKIYYTTNGMPPSTASTLYTGPITITQTELVRAIALAPGYSSSVEASKSYTIVTMAPAASPYFSLNGGSYKSPQTLILTDATPGATIYYTTNGTTPTTASNKYTGPITINTSELIIAIAVAPGYANSNGSSKLYKFDE